MATQVIALALTFSLFISQAASDPKKNEDTSHLSQALHVFSTGEDRRLMQNLVLDISEDGSIDLAPALAPAPAPSPSSLDCGARCVNRCTLNSRPKVCLRACGTCCVRCKCVPPGTSGNREMCGKCYTEMTTHGNKPKCP